jgi:uncharacterized protein
MPKAPKTRTCMVCRENFDKDDLLRFVVDPANNVMLDVYKKAPARGNYICNDEKCIEKAIKKSIIIKMLKANKSDTLVESVQKSLFTKICSDIGMLKKANRLVIGTDGVIDLLKSNKTKFVIFAEDISEKSQEKIEFYTHKNAVISVNLFNKEQLTELTGLANCSVLALKSSSLSNSLAKTIEFYKKVTKN